MEASSIVVQSPPETLRHLLNLTRDDFPNNPTLSMRHFEQYMARFESTAEYMAASIGQTIDTVTASAAAKSEAEFMQFLARLKRKENTVSRHIGRRDTLLINAKRFGLLPQGSPIELEWQPILDAAGRNSGGVRRIVEYAKSKNLLNRDFSQRDMNAWRAQAELEGSSEEYKNRAEKAFRRAIRKGKLKERFPLFDASKRIRPYSVFVKNMDEPLKANVMRYVTWAREQAELRELRIGESIVRQFEALCGYAITIRGRKNLTSVASLLTQEFLKEYVDWLHNDKGCQRPAICNRLGGIHTVVVHHADFQNEDFSWWPSLIDPVDPELKSAVDERREDRSAAYEELRAILPKMQEYRSSATNLSPVTLRWFVRDQLLMTIAIKMLWEPQIIRIARVDGTSPNLFKKEVPKNRPNLAFTPSARKAWNRNRSVELWQFDFEAERGVGAYGFMIEDVWSLLDEYVCCRNEMIGDGRDPLTLFFTRKLKPLSKTDLNLIVAKWTDKFLRRVTPESIRNSFIDYWLIEHPGDFISLRNILMISLDSVQARFDPDHKPTSNRGR
jgi:hypothetical protein